MNYEIFISSCFETVPMLTVSDCEIGADSHGATR